MDVSIIICTVDRAGDLRETLTSLSAVRTPGPTELLVMDNGSIDRTRAVVEEASRWYPFPLRYHFVAEQGKYAALNQGIKASSGKLIVATDDDARFEVDWLEKAVDGLIQYGCDFVGGPVRPIWGGPCPAWLDERDGMDTKVIALLDHGAAVREFGRGISWPLGVNVAYRRDAFERVGFFDNRLGRTAGTLRNQAQREWHLRGRAAGLRGMYLPDMVVHHLVPRERLNKRYFRRWMYWHGISRAMLYRYAGIDMEEPELETPPHAGGGRIAGVPRHLFTKAARSVRSLVWHTLRGNQSTAFDHEVWLCFFAGIVRQRWRDRRIPVAKGPATRLSSGDTAVAQRSAGIDFTLLG
jgi:glycosyltransferase involved in cell wall biosynthesis